MITFKKHLPELDLSMLEPIFRESDPRPAREQINDRYANGGGWTPFPGITRHADGRLTYPPEFEGEPEEVYPLIAEATLHGTERLELYLYSWMAIVQPDGSYEIARMD